MAAGTAAPAIRDEPVTLLDVAPTVAGLMGLGRPSHFQGRDLRRLPAGQALEIFEETYKPEAKRDRFGLVAYPWHLIITPETPETRGLRPGRRPGRDAGPGRRRSRCRPAVDALRKKLEARAREVLAGKETVKVDKGAEDMLRALGYIK